MSPILSPAFRSRLTALSITAVLASAAGGQAASAPLPFMPAPAEVLPAAPDVVLQRETPLRRVTLVTSTQVPAAQLARRYGVTPAAVTLLERAGQTRLAAVALPAVLDGRPPRRVPSVQSYTVRPGDALAGIAARFGLRVVDLLGTNLDRRSLDRLQAGEVLRIPVAERGLLLKIKPGQSALALIAGYGADLAATARANGVLPTELRVGDELLLPGIQAQGFEQQLLAQREAEQRALVAMRRQQKYEQYLAWQRERERERLNERYERQAKYEEYLAWKNSPERQRQIAAFERQAQYEAAQAAARRRAQARPAPVRAVVQTASTSGQTAVASGADLIWPMRSFRLTSRYGERDIAFHRAFFHGGIDLAAPYGTPIYAAAGGTVTQSGYGAFGLNVFTDGPAGTLVYGHMSRTAVVAGQPVAQGQLLGYVGCTGVCTGPHLHFEVRIRGQTVNPLAMLP